MKEYDQMYLEELRRIPVPDAEETKMLLQRLPDGAAAERLISGNLAYVACLAGEYASEHTELLDLIQEGSMALTLLVKQYREGDFEAMKERAVRTAMQLFCDSQSQNDRINEKMAASVNVLNEVTTRLAEELGREATLAEAAAKMQMPEDEVRILMKEAVNAVSAEGK